MRFFNKNKKLLFFSFLFIFVCGISLYLKSFNYVNNYEMELKKVDIYNKIAVNKKYNQNKYNIYLYFARKILNDNYSIDFLNIINDDYFKVSFFERYYSFYKKNVNLSSRDIVEYVNCSIDNEYYSHIYINDKKFNNAILVNKFNGLSKEFKSDNLVNIEKQYGYNNKIDGLAYAYFKKMADDMKKENLNIFIVSAFRNYDYQNNIYNNYVKLDGRSEADRYSARPGFSEHQTGLAIDVRAGANNYTKFEKSSEYKWMLQNSYKYGFILRYPNNKEKQTGYKFEAWHYRFLGVELATNVYKSGLTYDEYYEFFIKK